MRKILSSSGKRFVLAIVAMMAFAANASAGSTWYAYYAKISASPAGNGKVYATSEYEAKPAASDYQDEQEIQMVATFGYNYIYAYAKPADGFKFVGWTRIEPSLATTDSIIDKEANGAYIELKSEITDNPEGTGESDSLTVAGMMPLEPNNNLYAIFAKVTAKVETGLDSLGTVSVSNLCNVEGDEITLTATPREGATFVNWTCDGEEVSTDAKMKITVGKDCKEYVASFDSPDLVVLHFPAEGGYLYWYDEANDIYLDESRDLYSLSFSPDSVVAGKDKSYVTPTIVTYYSPAQNAEILHGKGDTKVVKIAADPESISTNYNLMNRWSGENGVKCDTLDNTCVYYTFDGENKCFNIATEIPANETYIAMPDSCYKNAGLTEAPSVVYMQNAEPAGIKNVQAVTIPGYGKVYTIDGKEVTAPKQHGLYIINRKKVLK